MIMKKILVVLNGTDYPAHVVDYGLKLAEKNGSELQAVVLAPPSTQVTGAYYFPNDLGLAGAEEPLEAPGESDTKIIEANLALFKEDGREAMVPCSVGAVSLTPEDLVEETAFADLVLSHTGIHMGLISLEELLSDSRCPVVLVPRGAELPTRAVLCYDESYSSIYAIKMYAYLLPECRHLPTTLLTINPKGDNGNGKAGRIKDWLPHHFPQLQIRHLQGNLQKELTGFIGIEAHSTVVIMGAYGRNALSRIFHKSLSRVVMEETGSTLFVVHE